MKLMAKRSAGEYELPEKVGVIYSDVKRSYFPTRSLYITEKDADEDASLIGEYLKTLGITVLLYPGNEELPVRLRKDHPQLVINLVDSIKGNESLAAAIPGVLELLDIPYTGADILGLSLDTNKFLVKKLLQQNGIPVPSYQLFNTATDYLDPRLRLQLLGLGASRWQMIWLLWREARLPLLAALMAAFGSVISEVGASMMVGGNIRYQTRVLTTAIVLETGKGEFELAIRLALLLLAITFLVNLALTRIQQRSARR